MIFFLICMLILLICGMLNYLNFFMKMKKKMKRENKTPFECGFDPLSHSRLPFSIQFYLISMIFLIFDIEIIIFLPMIPSYFTLNYLMWFMIIYLFISLLIFGLYIEWKDGALKWLK